MILLVVEYSNGKMSKSTLEMTTAARGMGREGPITLLVLGSGVASVAEQAALFADQVLVADKPELAQYDPGGLERRGRSDRAERAKPTRYSSAAAAADANTALASPSSWMRL